MIEEEAERDGDRNNLAERHKASSVATAKDEFTHRIRQYSHRCCNTTVQDRIIRLLLFFKQVGH